MGARCPTVCPDEWGRWGWSGRRPLAGEEEQWTRTPVRAKEEPKRWKEVEGPGEEAETCARGTTSNRRGRGSRERERRPRRLRSTGEMNPGERIVPAQPTMCKVAARV